MVKFLKTNNFENWLSKNKIFQTDIVKKEYDRIYRNYGLLHATYQTAMDPATHLDAHVQKQYDIIKVRKNNKLKRYFLS